MVHGYRNEREHTCVGWSPQHAKLARLVRSIAGQLPIYEVLAMIDWVPGPRFECRGSNKVVVFDADDGGI